MSNIVLLFVCLVIGMILDRTGKVPANAPATINGVIIHVSLPALILQYVHRVDLHENLLAAAVMPWLLFGIGALMFWLAGKTLKLSRGTTGALMMLGGLGNTSFIGLPMIESFYGPTFLSVGILIDQLGTYLVLSTLGIAVACIYSDSSASWREIAWRIATFPPLLSMLLALALIPVATPSGWRPPCSASAEHSRRWPSCPSDCNSGSARSWATALPSRWGSVSSWCQARRLSPPSISLCSGVVKP